MMISPKGIRRTAITGVLIAFTAMAAALSLYVVPEGHVAVVKYTGKADRQESPGLQTKFPFLETVEIFEVRERKNREEMAAATKNRLPVTAVVSINWTVNKEAAIDLYVRYGGLDQFEERVLDPRMRSAAKAAIAHYGADEIIRDRVTVVAEIQRELVSVTDDLPISINTTQLENIELPKAYMDSILAKEQARENAEREEHALVQQKLVAQQKVQTAEAERDARKALADGRAYQIQTEAQAEAEAINMIQEQLAKSPTYVELVKAKAWNGQLPTTMLGAEADILYAVK
jgi:regulator of protease activity HflC (stomatin/prohibitin superfamily)